jgi:tetraacyldisaccharide 4'-kinase
MKLIIPNFWREKNLISILLIPLSWVYAFISSLNLFKPLYTSKAKIITIGNITMGGAGKTPVALSIAKMLKEHKLAILTRGYKGKLKGPLIVNDSHNINDIGDEALLLKKQAVTCVSKNRLEGIKFLEDLGYDLIITDDGLQDSRFKKDISIVVVDSYFGFGNGLIFPAGPLRESKNSGLKKTSFIALIGDKEIDLETSTPIIKAKLVSDLSLDNRSFIAFAGIGNPDKFFHSVKEAGGTIIQKIAFGDHHQYTNKEIDDLYELAKMHKAELITTEKDYTRIDRKEKISVLPVTLKWSNVKDLLSKLS